MGTRRQCGSWSVARWPQSQEGDCPEMNPVTSAVRTSVDSGASAKLELVDKFCYLGDMLSVDGDADAELELVGISSGSWYHCLPIRTCL